jgi:hypothetical protein
MKGKGISFNSLPLTDKKLLIDEFAKYLMCIDYFDFRVHLYALNHHFVELQYNIKTDEVERVEIIAYADIDRWLIKLDLTK